MFVNVIKHYSCTDRKITHLEYYHEHTNTFLSVSEAVVLTDPNFKLLRKLDKKLLDEDFDTEFS